MLVELRVRDLGVIDDQTLLLGSGMTALTGETGAGKTLIVEAIELLLGARADAVLVRPGASEAVIEGRFVGAGGDEVVLGRVVPARGRSRAYLDGRMATSGALAEAAGDLVDLHGQHAHQSLLSPSQQRAELDAFAGIDGARVEAAGAELRRLSVAADALGGDARARAREMDLLRFQLDELDAAALDDPSEEDALREEDERLADATAHRDAAETVHQALAADDGVTDRLRAAVVATTGRAPLRDLEARLRALLAEAEDLGSEARSTAEGLEDDPVRLAAIGQRRHVIADLRRKYGDNLAEVIAYRVSARTRLEELVSHDQRSAELSLLEVEARSELEAAETELGEARRAAVGPLGAAVEERLRELAMPRAQFYVQVGDDRAGSSVTWMLGANPGEPALPLTKVASGGELARTMLAVRLVLGSRGASAEAAGVMAGRDGTAGGSGAGGSAGAVAGSGAAGGFGEAVSASAEALGLVTGRRGPGRAVRTLVFDEVDAGIGGGAAVAVARALAALGADDQVLVVTHLPQVAAVADDHVVVTKVVSGERTRAEVRAVEGADRVAELSRMLSGRPDSPTAREHAEELLAGRDDGADVRSPRSRGRVKR